MNIIIPLNNKKEICKLDDKNEFALISMDNGTILKVSYHLSKEMISDNIHFLIVSNKNEDVDDFYDEGIEVLIAPFQKNVDDIIEAFIFRELHDFES